MAGVPTVLIADGRAPHPVRDALSGAATRVTLAGADGDARDAGASQS